MLDQHGGGAFAVGAGDGDDGRVGGGCGELNLGDNGNLASAKLREDRQRGLEPGGDDDDLGVAVMVPAAAQLDAVFKVGRDLAEVLVAAGITGQDLLAPSGEQVGGGQAA